MRKLWSGDFVTTTRRVLHRRERPHLHAARGAPEGVRLGLRAQRGGTRGPHRRRVHLAPSPDKESLEIFRKSGGAGKPTQVGYKVCWGRDDDACVETAHRLWATSGVPGELSQVLPSPKHFEQVSSLVTKDMTRESIAYGTDLEAHVEAFAPFADDRLRRDLHLADRRSREEQRLPRLLRLLRRDGAAATARVRLIGSAIRHGLDARPSAHRWTGGKISEIAHPVERWCRIVTTRRRKPWAQ